MAEDTEQLKDDIEATREDLTRDLDALTDKVSPGRVVERRVEATKSGARGLKDRIMGTASGAVGKTRSSVMGTTSGAAGSVKGGVSSVQNSASGAAQGVAGKAQDFAGSATSAVSGTKDTVQRQAEGNPLAAGLIAFGVGWLVSSLMPASQRETQAAHSLVDAAKEHGAPLADHAKQVGKEVAESLQGTAQEAVQSVKSSAQDSVSTVTEEAKGSAQNVAQDAKNS